MSDEVDPTQYIDYCSNGCVPETATVTPWIGEECGCCGGIWGGGGRGTCRGVHIVGDVWLELLDAEQAGPS